jgi:HSP20 family protein
MSIGIIIEFYIKIKRKEFIMNRSLISKTGSPFLDFAKEFWNDDLYLYTSPFFESKRNGGLSNVAENENEYVIEISAPGLKKEDIKIELENDVLKIYSNFEDQKEEKNGGYYRREFVKSSFERSFAIPKNINKEAVSASMENGILNVVIPKLKEEKKNENIKITIK